MVFASKDSGPIKSILALGVDNIRPFSKYTFYLKIFMQSQLKKEILGIWLLQGDSF